MCIHNFLFYKNTSHILQSSNRPFKNMTSLVSIFLKTLIWRQEPKNRFLFSTSCVLRFCLIFFQYSPYFEIKCIFSYLSLSKTPSFYDSNCYSLGRTEVQTDRQTQQSQKSSLLYNTTLKTTLSTRNTIQNRYSQVFPPKPLVTLAVF